jgi:hypothetical protein
LRALLAERVTASSGDDRKTKMEKVSHGGSLEKKKKRWEHDQTSMDSRKGIHDGVEHGEPNP